MNSSLLPNIFEFLARLDPFDKLPEEIQKQVASSIHITYLCKGEQISIEQQSEERYLYIVRAGAMEQRKPDGKLRAQLGVGDLFGFSLLVDAETRGYSTTAIENTLLYLIPHKQLQALLENEPKFSACFATNARTRLKSALEVTWNNEEKGQFIKKVSEVANSQIAIISTTDTIQNVAKAMRDQRRSSAVVIENGKLAGIVTDRDMTKRVVAEGLDIHRPISEVMTCAPKTVAPNDLVLNAVSIMIEHNVRSLPVVDGDQVTGILTAVDLINNHRMQAVYLINDIHNAESLEVLEGLSSQRQAIFEALVEGKVSAFNITRVMTLISDAYNRRLLQLGEQLFGQPPCEYAWMVAGSHARFEIHMLSDQDNALVIDDSATEEDMQYFSQLANFVCDGLAACGYHNCKGGYMASNPQWCQRHKDWLKNYGDWVMTPDMKTLLNISVFLDTRCIHGQSGLLKDLEDFLYDKVKDNKYFFSVMMNSILEITPPLGVFKNFVLIREGENRKTLNLKQQAISLVIDLARLYGLSSGCRSSSTEKRLESAFKAGMISKDTLGDLLGAYQFIAQVRLQHQLEALKQSSELKNHINPKTLGHFERNHLKDAFRIISERQEAAKFRFAM